MASSTTATTASRPATPTRRTESQARTRQLVLEAAERLFLANGFGATSLEDIAREAGFSKGAVYSNFAGKTDLFFAIVEGQFVDLSAQLRQAVTAEEDPAAQLAAVGTWYQSFLQVEAGWSRSLPELAAIAAQDDEARRRFTALIQSIEAAVADLLEDQQRTLGIRFGLPPKSIAALVVSLVVGLTVRSLHDMESPPELFSQALARLLTP
jgi:AcrR family transcriptional regulator